MKVLDGSKIFKLVDAYGLPLDIINLELRERGLAFDVSGFMQSAIKAGWKKNRILWMMKTDNDRANTLLDKTYEALVV